MKLLIISDAWHPQVNGVVRTLEATTRVLREMGHMVKIIGPEKGLFSFAAPSYPEIRLEFFAEKRLLKILKSYQPDYVHISTEGPLGMAMRSLCVQLKKPYSTAYHTCFPEYLEARVPGFLKRTIKLITYQWIKRLHVPSGAVMVSTPTMEKLLRRHRIHRIQRWSRGVDTSIFKPYGKDLSAYKNLPRPLYIYVGRVAVEKNLDAFLALDLSGSKIVIGDGPELPAFKQKYPAVHFLGKKSGVDLARHYAAADVFVFPSKTDTFGLVLLEALACGLAIAAYPVQGPIDIFCDTSTASFAVLDDDLGQAALRAAALPAPAEKGYAYVEAHYSWESCTRQFLSHLQAPSPFAVRRLTRFERVLDGVQNFYTHVKHMPKFYPPLYRSLGFFLMPLLPLYLYWRAQQGKEDKTRLKERFGTASIARPSGKLIWLHAASVGESLALLPLLSTLETHPKKPALLLTTGTRSSADLLKKRLPPCVMHQYIPLDTLQANDAFLDHWRPDLALMTESEFWPNMLARIRKRGIPAALINGRISTASARHWNNIAGLWIAQMLSSFHIVLAQSKGDAARLQQLGAYGAVCVGNLKAAADTLPYDAARITTLNLAGRPCWLMASTHEGEDEHAMQAHKKISAEIGNLLTIIIPRHAKRADSIIALAARHHLKAQRRSVVEPVNEKTEIYIADTMGEMGLFYKVCRIVCVAGSFGTVGGHNPLEPAHFGNAVIFGPDMAHFSDIAESMLAAGAAQQVHDSKDLSNAVIQLLKNPDQVKKNGEAALMFMQAQKQVLERIIAALQPMLQKALA